MSLWDRLEMMTHSLDFSAGLEARIADPLWLLSRQWQVAEFQGEDAAQPAAVRITSRQVPLTQMKPAGGEVLPLPASKPLEMIVESSPVPDFGAAGLHAAARASRRLLRLLKLGGLPQAFALLRSAFPLMPPDRLVVLGAASAQAADLFTRLGLDALAVAQASPETIHAALAGALSPAKVERVDAILARWALEQNVQTGSPAWNDEQLEYQFSVGTGGKTAQSAGQPTEPPGGLTLAADGYTGGRLDWFSFDLAASAPAQATARVKTLTTVPAPVRYQGMPASRWWQFEDGSVNFGDLDAGPTDLFRLLVSEFAAAYSSDWFIIPMRVPIGTLSEIPNFVLMDNFGGRENIRSAAENDAGRAAGSTGARVWRMFELTGDEVGAGHPSPWLLAAPSLTDSSAGPVLERVSLVRDEAANLAWAIESLVEGVLGRSVNRAEAWHAAQPLPAPLSASPEGEAVWNYHVETPVPGWWIPLLPERVSPGSVQTRFRRARMQQWNLSAAPSAARQAGPQGLFLDPRKPVWIDEAEVPVSGVRLERAWQFGRWVDGSYFVWLQRAKKIGRGERSSGLRWDTLE